MVRTLWVAAAVIADAGRVLLTQRKQGGHHPGLWEFPGGKVEEGEAPRAALARELREELGIEVEVGAVMEVTFTPSPERPIALLFFRTTRRAGSPEPRAIDVADLRWFEPDELDPEAMPPGDRPMLARLAQAAKRSTANGFKSTGGSSS